jgi:hypothetical protein
VVETACASHPAAASIGTCGRCGRFCCLQCVAEPEPLLCSECLALAGDPFALRAQPFATLSALRVGWGLLLATLGPATAVAVVFALPAFGLSWLMSAVPDARSEAWVLSFYDWLVGVLGQLAVFALVIAAAEGRRLTLRGALSEATGRWGRAVWANLRQTLWIGLFSLLLVVPGLWMSVLLFFSPTAVVRDDADALQCSRELVRGRWWRVAWWLFWAGVIAYGPSVAIGILVGIGARTLHLELPAMTMQLLENVFTRLYAPVVMPALSVAAYYQLHLSSGRELPPMTWKSGARRSFEAASLR